MSLIHCFRCMRQIVADDVFCRFCGQQQPLGESAPVSAPVPPVVPAAVAAPPVFAPAPAPSVTEEPTFRIVSANGQHSKPVSAERLRLWAREKAILPHSLLLTEGGETVRADAVPELRPVFPRAFVAPIPLSAPSAAPAPIVVPTSAPIVVSPAPPIVAPAPVVVPPVVEALPTDEPLPAEAFADAPPMPDVPDVPEAPAPDDFAEVVPTEAAETEDVGEGADEAAPVPVAVEAEAVAEYSRPDANLAYQPVYKPPYPAVETPRKKPWGVVVGTLVLCGAAVSWFAFAAVNRSDNQTASAAISANAAKPTETNASTPEPRTAQQDFALYQKRLAEVSDIGAILARIDLSTDGNEVTLTMRDTWVQQSDPIRQKSAQTFWKWWSEIHSPADPDRSKIYLKDLKGDALGGTKWMGGTTFGIYVEPQKR